MKMKLVNYLKNKIMKSAMGGISYSFPSDGSLCITVNGNNNAGLDKLIEWFSQESFSIQKPIMALVASASGSDGKCIERNILNIFSKNKTPLSADTKVIVNKKMQIEMSDNNKMQVIMPKSNDSMAISMQVIESKIDDSLRIKIMKLLSRFKDGSLNLQILQTSSELSDEEASFLNDILEILFLFAKEGGDFRDYLLIKRIAEFKSDIEQCRTEIMRFKEFHEKDDPYDPAIFCKFLDFLLLARKNGCYSESLAERVCQLTLTQFKTFYFAILGLDQDYIKHQDGIKHHVEMDDLDVSKPLSQLDLTQMTQKLFDYLLELIEEVPESFMSKELMTQKFFDYLPEVMKGIAKSSMSEELEQKVVKKALSQKTACYEGNEPQSLLSILEELLAEQLLKEDAQREAAVNIVLPTTLISEQHNSWSPGVFNLKEAGASDNTTHVENVDFNSLEFS